MYNPRTRLVSLRMTEEEYERLRDRSEGQGARSVSEFARNLLLSPSNPGGQTDVSCSDLSMLGERISRVEQDVAQVKNDLLTHSHTGEDLSLS